MNQTFSIVLKDQPDTLVRLTGLLYRRGYLIENLVVQPVYENNNVQVTISLRNCSTTHHVLRQLDKLFNVVTAEAISSTVQTSMPAQALAFNHGYTTPL
ncbi:hypothetical protein SDC9_82862 [bioreactor metagenome]|uniref:ACT domain-containing protein n=1 Tax=bioreactor metagenome TaxID=1076179 RepID=A0A644Z6L8_9ZZZZ|nr:ACT domain-containing protein [Negativicutes bacterium]